jgi:predicted ABC-type ATPase
MLVLLMRKARRRGNLVPVKKQVTRGGKSFMQIVWVNPQKNMKQSQGRSPKDFIASEKFNAANWSKQFIDPKATPDETGVEYVLKSFGAESAEIAEKIVWAQKVNKTLKPTHEEYQIEGSGRGVDSRYKPERAALHGRIIQDLLSPDKIIMAKPEPGEKPKIMMLGGRGGSGKSWFKIDPKKNPGGGIYDPGKFVILDADSIKEQLKPPYAGYNAYQVHEESSDILEKAIDACIALGLNVVLDMTMKTPESAIERITRFKERGYSTEAHYMHLPPQEAAKRAIARYRDGEGKPGEYKGRFVPVDTILKMRKNEEAFDIIKAVVDDWSFRDSSGGFPPVLISSKSGKSA